MHAPAPGSLTSIVIEKMKTPPLKVKFCNIAKPFYYPNSPDIPRYSITCIVDPEKNKDFVKIITNIEKNEHTKQSILKPDVAKNEGNFVNTGNWILKFSHKEPIRIVARDGEKLLPFEETEEVRYGQDVIVEFDIIRYTKRGTTEVGLSLRPHLITIIKNPPQQQNAEMNVATKTKSILEDEDLF